MLTGNARNDFMSWLNDQPVAPYAVMFDEIPMIVRLSYIVEWLDSIRYVIEVEYERNTRQFYGTVIYIDKGIRVDISNNFHNRISVLTEAILQAIILYNNYGSNL